MLHPLTKPFNQFVKEARKVHGQKYKYLEKTYRGARPKMTIVCPEHGPFPQSPYSHLTGRECKKCATNLNVTTQTSESLNRLKDHLFKKTKNCVKLDESTFHALNSIAYFECTIHGRFKKRAYDCLTQTHPCTKCGRGYSDKGYTNKEALTLVRERVAIGFEVIPFNYTGKNTDITIICPNHGNFLVKFGSTHRGIKCRGCAQNKAMPKRIESLNAAADRKRASRFENWLKRAEDMHGKKYDYSKVNYKTMKSRVLIGCAIHGYVEQIAETHLTKGCRKCADEQLAGKYSEKYFDRFPERKIKPAIIYYIKIKLGEDVFYKVGITTTSVKNRFSSAYKGVTVNTMTELRTTLYLAYLLESKIQRGHGDRFRYRPKVDAKLVRELRIGPSECFSKPLSDRQLKRYFSISNVPD